MSTKDRAWHDVAVHVLAGLASKGPVHSETEISARVTIALSYADAFVAQLEQRQPDDSGTFESG